MLRLLNAGRQVMPPVTKYTNLKVERVLDYDDRTLSFSIPVNAMPVDMMLENYIQTQEDEYVIKQITLNGNYYDITAQLNIDELEGTHWETFTTTEQTVQQTANLALAGTGWTCKCDISKKRSIKKTNVYTWDILKQIVKTYRVEMAIDSLNKNITFVEKRGEDKGVYFSSQLNLKSVGKQAQTTDFYTIILPIGKDGLTIESVNNGKKYLENYTYSSKKKTYYWKDERYTVAQNLKEDAEAKLADMATPRVSYSCSIIDLAKAKKNDYNFLEYDLGDTVTIVDNYTNIRIAQRIVKMTEYPESPEQNQCEISNVKLTFEELAQKYEGTADTVDNITTDNGTVDGDAIDSIPASKVLELDEVIANSAKFKQVDTEILNVSGMLTATNARIGTLETTALTATTADIRYAKIENLSATNAKINALEANALTANSAEIKSLKAGVADINTLMFGTASGGSLTTEFSNSVVGLIGDAQIKSAQIKDISADKILSGKLYTNLVEIVSQSGNLDIADNTIQIRDNNKTARVQIGKDATGDYNIYIWDKNGKLMFDPLYGVQESGIKKAIIRNDMISDTANISGKKIDIASLISTINADGSNTLNASKIYVDTDKQTLDVSFKNLTTSVSTVSTKVTTAVNTANTANTTANSAKSTATTANTTANTAKSTADVAKQTATTANNTANTANSNANSALSKANTLETSLKTVTEKVTTQGTQLTAIQGNISSKIWQQDITTAVTGLEIGGRNLVRNGNFVDGNTATSSNWNNWGSPSIREFVTINNKKWCHIKGTGTAQYQGINQNTGIRIEKDTQYTISIRVKGAKDNQIFAIGVHWNTTSTIVAQSWKYPTVGTTDKIVTATFRTPNNADVNHFNLMLGVSSATTIYEVYFTDIKLEKGNKATDWTPAPEDVDSSITSLENSTKTLSTQYTSLNQTLTSLSATVNSNTTKINTKADGSTVTSLQSKVTTIQADLNGYKTTVTNTYATKSSLSNYATTTAMNSAINQKANSITQSVSATYSTKAELNNLQIGGTNLAENTNQGVKGWNWLLQTGGRTITEVTEQGVKACKITRDNVATSGWNYISYSYVGRSKILPDTTYTIAVDVKSSVASVLTPNIRRGNATDTLLSTITAIKNTTVANKWVRLQWTIKTLSTLPSTTDQVLYINVGNAGTGVWYMFKNLKIELGTKATDWTPCPVDMATQASLELKINKDKLISEINAAADLINLKSNRLTWTSTNTSMTKEGKLTCNAGVIGGFTISSKQIYTSSTADATHMAGMSAYDFGKDNTGNWAFWAGKINASTVNRHVFSVGHEGNVYLSGMLRCESATKATKEYMTLESNILKFYSNGANVSSLYSGIYTGTTSYGAILDAQAGGNFIKLRKRDSAGNVTDGLTVNFGLNPGGRGERIIAHGSTLINGHTAIQGSSSGKLALLAYNKTNQWVWINTGQVDTDYRDAIVMQNLRLDGGLYIKYKNIFYKLYDFIKKVAGGSL